MLRLILLFLLEKCLLGDQVPERLPRWNLGVACNPPTSWLVVCKQSTSCLVVCNPPTSWLVGCKPPNSWLTVCKPPTSWLVGCKPRPNSTLVAFRGPGHPKGIFQAKTAKLAGAFIKKRKGGVQNSSASTIFFEKA